MSGQTTWFFCVYRNMATESPELGFFCTQCSFPLSGTKGGSRQWLPLQQKQEELEVSRKASLDQAWQRKKGEYLNGAKKDTLQKVQKPHLLY
jgi:hypothetical protein